MLGKWSFGDNGINTKSIILKGLQGSGLKTLAVDTNGNIIFDSTRIGVKDSSTYYYTPYYIDQNFATKSDLTAIDVGLVIKDSVSVATTANLDLSGAETIDGIGTYVGMRVLVKNQTDSIQNGVYSVAAGAWSRTTDLNTWAELYRSYVAVSRGTTQGGASYVCGIGNTGTIDVNKVWFNLFTVPSSVVAGAGLDNVGNNYFVYVDNSTVETNSDILRIKDAGVSNTKVAPGIDAVKIGNGTISNTEFQQLNGLRTDSTIQSQIDSKSKYNVSGNGIYDIQQGNPYNYYGIYIKEYHDNGTVDSTFWRGATPSFTGFMHSSQASKLAGIETGAEVNVQADWNETSTSADDYIKNKPSIASAEDSSLFTVSGLAKSKIATAKAGITQIKLDNDSTENKIVIGSNASAKDMWIRNTSGALKITDQYGSGFGVDATGTQLGLYYAGSLKWSLPLYDAGTSGYVLTTAGSGQPATWTEAGSSTGTGTVTSVGLSLPTALFDMPVTGSPITTLGTFAPTLATQTANTVFAANSGSTPTFRALVDDDIPNTITASNYLPLAGGTLTGGLIIPANTSSVAMLRLTQSSVNPSTLVNGNVWCTASGFFGRYNNTTIALGTAGTGGVTTLTQTAATGLFNSGTTSNPFLKVGFDSLTTVVSSLSDYIAIADASSSSTATSPKTLYKFTLDSLKARIGTTFALTVKDIDGTPICSNIHTIVCDGITVVDSAAGIVKFIATPSTGTGDEPFQTLAETGSITWSWLTSKNAKIPDVDGNITLTLTNQDDGEDGYLEIKADATTDYTITFPAGCRYANKRLTRVFTLEHGDNNYYVFYFKYNGTATNIDYAIYGVVN